MKILVMSDSHGWNEAMINTVEYESPNMILHLGDKCTDCECLEQMFPEIPLRSVKGNCDFGTRGIDMDEFVVEGKRFFMTHGHLFGVKLSKLRVIDAAAKREADILLFGHTHIQHYEDFEGMIVLNPGCIGLNIKSYAVIELIDGEVIFELKKS